jgi:GntR family transcriptional regulator
VLAAAGVHLRSGHATISAEGAGPTDARRLGVRRNAALLVETRLVNDVAGEPIELTQSRYAGDRYGLDVLFDVEPA